MDIFTLEDFKMWSATTLKSFLAVRNKSVDGSFEELASRYVQKMSMLVYK